MQRIEAMIKKSQMLFTGILLTLTLIGILLGIQLYGTPVGGLTMGVLLFLIYGSILGYDFTSLSQMMVKGVQKAALVLVVMALIGMLSASWMLSGTIPAMMIYGFRYLLNLNFVVAAFIITSVISMVLGTSLGTVSTIGIPLLEIGKAMGAPLPLIAGGIISGAYLGDRTSPMSSSANLLAAVTETRLSDMLKKLLTTTAPVYAVCLIVYFLLGKQYGMSQEIATQVDGITAIINTAYQISWYQLIPPIIIFTLILFKVPIVYCISSGLISALILTLATQGRTLVDVLQILLNGFHPNNQELASLISGGGLYSMKRVIMIITVSTALNGMLEGMGLLKPFIDSFLKGIKKGNQLITRTVFLSFIVAVLTCNQSLAIIMPGKFLKREYEEWGIDKTSLARAIADSGVVTVPLIPWNVNAVAIASIMGVDTIKYIPFALLCYLLPIATIIIGYLENREKEKHLAEQKHFMR